MTEYIVDEPQEPEIPGVELLNGTFEFDSYNIPVNLGIYPEEVNGRPTGNWILSSGNYAPVADDLNLDKHVVKSDDPEALRELVRERVIPVYRTALEQLEAIADGKSDWFHSWERADREKESQK